MKKLILAILALALITNGCASKRTKPTVYQVGPEAFANISSNARIHWQTSPAACPAPPIKNVECVPSPIRYLKFNRLPTAQETAEYDRLDLVNGGYALAIREGKYVTTESSPTGVVEAVVNTGLAAVALVTPGPIGQIAGGLLPHMATSSLSTVTTKTTRATGEFYLFLYPSGKTATAVCSPEENKILGKCREKMLKALKDRALQIQPAESPS